MSPPPTTRTPGAARGIAEQEAERRGHSLSYWAGTIAWCIACHAEAQVFGILSSPGHFGWTGAATTGRRCPYAPEEGS